MSTFDHLPPEAKAQLERCATPAHLAITVTADMPDDVKWRPAKHLLYINERITRACLSPVQEFIDLEVSVRHGKSWLVSAYTAAWYIGMFPDRRVALLSYNQDKASEWGEVTLELIDRWGRDLFGISVDPKKRAKNLWGIKGRRGEVLSTGLGGTITGKGFDLAVIDDPIKNREDADSAAERKKLRDGYYSNVRTRLSPHGTVVLAMARWREDDLAGDVVHGFAANENLSDVDNDLADRWEVIRLPAIAEAPKGEDPETWRDVIGRAEGEPLWPELWPLPLLHKLRATNLMNSPQDWHSLYQQNPTAKEGKDFKVDAWKILPHVDRNRLRLVRWWDLAATEDGGDWTVGALVGMDHDGETYVLDIQRFRKNASGVERHVKMVARNDGIAVPVRLEQEKSGSGKAVANTYKRLLTGYDVDAKQPDGKKEVRAAPYAAQQQEGRVTLLRAPWNDDFIEEHRVFPRGRNDDQVDAVAAAFNFLALAGPTTIEIDAQMNTPLASLYGNARPRVAADLVAAARSRFRR